MQFLRKMIFALGRFVLSLRYKIEIVGLEKLKQKGWEGGILFCPNHPAEVDPIIMINYFFPRYETRPLVVEHFFHLPGAAPFMKLVKALDVPNFETSANKWKKKKADEAMDKILSGLEKGNNYLIYPSGHLRRSPQENVGGSSFVHKVVAKRPETKIVLVRMEGLWGSSFSRALTGNLPDFWKELFKGIIRVLKNGIFFTPRRKIKITVEPEPEGLPKGGTRLEFNRFLDEWYNRYDYDGVVENAERITLVPFTFYNKSDVAKVSAPQVKHATSHNFTIPPEMKTTVYKKLFELAHVPKENINDEMKLSTDLGLDSLDIATVHAFLDQKYGATQVSPTDLITVKDLFAAALGKMGASTPLRLPDEKKKEMKWPKEKMRPEPLYPHAQNIPLAFLKTCDRMGDAIACGDAITGPLTYKKFKLFVLVFAEILKKKEDRFIGIMLPSSTVSYILVFATLLAGKVPVMFNWTIGQRSLDYAHNLLDIHTIITSRTFLDRIGHLELGEAFSKDLCFVETIRKSIGIKEKLLAVYRAKRGSQYIAKKFNLDAIHENDPAVLLFTSGTETYPKAVPLTHRNIMTNQEHALTVIDLKGSDCMYGVLPAFHSFGFSVTGTFPFLSGIKVFFSPDPTDSMQMARDIQSWNISILCLAPTFLQNLFSVAKKEQLTSVRMFVSGAEKAPDELLEYVRALGEKAEFIEGYGITECSPIVTINPPGELREGVGRAIPGVSLCVIDPETEKLLPQGDTGEVCIHGDSVFAGYMTPTAKNPFIEIGGQQWYRSGDLGKVTKEGSLLLMGRIKRFIKIGGEMISLTSIEDAIRMASIEKNWDPKKGKEPSVAVSVRNADSSKPEVVLFSTFPLTKDDANKVLKEQGFGRIVKIAEVREIPEIPLTGTGKVHFRRLSEMVEA